MNFLAKLGMLILAAIIIYGIVAFAVTYWRIRVGKQLAADATVYTQEVANPQHSILILGDSSGVGVGAAQHESVAALLGDALPNASIENRSVSGFRIADLESSFTPKVGEHYDLIILQIGGNDIVRSTPMEEFGRKFTSVVERATKTADSVIHIHGGDIGNAPIFLPPTNYVMSWRTREYREVMKNADEQFGVQYIDIYSLEEGGARSDEPNKRTWFAGDGFHPSAASYKFWYESIEEVLKNKTDLL